jgi:hypothetical protein
MESILPRVLVGNFQQSTRYIRFIHTTSVLTTQWSNIEMKPKRKMNEIQIQERHREKLIGSISINKGDWPKKWQTAWPGGRALLRNAGAAFHAYSKERPRLGEAAR